MSIAKEELRKKLGEARQREPKVAQKSERICDMLFSLPEFRSSENVLFYISIEAEICTTTHIPKALALKKNVIAPFCEEDEIELCRIQSISELAPGRFNILEPTKKLREQPGRMWQPDNLDLVLIPGLAFDAKGGRLGRGKGFYDRFLARVPVSTHIIGLAFESQIVPEVPTEPHDRFMDMVITEESIYRSDA